MGVITDILAFIVAIGVLVTVHEFGHFWVARRVGVRVLRFSVGFGKPLWRRQGKDGTEYVIAAIPLGGYVKMLDEREGDVADELRHRAFNRKPLWARNAVVAAGPVFNFIFAIVAYWLIFVMGTSVLRPVIGEVEPGTPAQAAGFVAGEEIVAVDGEQTQGWDQVLLALLEHSGTEQPVPVTVETPSGAEHVRQLPLDRLGALGDNPNLLAAVGLQPKVPRIEPRIGRVLPDSAAAQANLTPGERIVAVGGEPVDTWAELVAALQPRPGETVTLTLADNGERREVTVTLGSRETDQGRVGMLGISPDVPERLYDELRRTIQYGPVAAVGAAAESTWQAISLTVELLWKMALGEASMKNLSGPINIAQYAGDSVSMGLQPFLRFLALVSISLGVLNLLPVPVLDGGHLLYNGIEWVRGRPLSEQAQAVGQQIGIALLVLLMGVAFYNDLARLFGPL